MKAQYRKQAPPRGVLDQGASLLKSFLPGSEESSRVPAADFKDTAPSWEQLQALVDEQRKGLNLPEPSLEEGPPNPLSLKRTFGKEGPIEVKLYRDHAGWCPYCQKVWLQLEEKQIPYTLEKINMRCYGPKPQDFMRMVPSGLLPVLEIDGRVWTESAVIGNLLEERFPQRPLLPPNGSPEHSRSSFLFRLERQHFSDWLSWLCTPGDRGQEDLEATLGRICQELEVEEGPWFLQDFSLVDIVFAPFLERMVASLAYYKGFYARGQGRYPALERWFAAMEERPAYLATRSDHYTHCHDLPPQLGGCCMTKKGEPVAALIDGLAGDTWRLPLPPLSATSLPEAFSPGEDPPRDRLEAAARLVANHANVARFAARGCGKPGRPAVTAPLADPFAAPAEEHVPAVDTALRHVAHALLLGPEAAEAEQALAVVEAGQGIGGQPVVASLKYLRDRVGVPRDLKYPAAR